MFWESLISCLTWKACSDEHSIRRGDPKHSNDKYRRVVWQCNHKFKDKTRCSTPHLTEDQVKAAFVRMANKLYADREFYITELTAIMDRLADTTALEKERRILDEQLGVDAKAVTDLIARNARVARNQKEYNERYDALVSRYEDTERKRDAVVEQIDQIMIRRRKIERFIESIKDLPELITSSNETHSIPSSRVLKEPAGLHIRSFRFPLRIRAYGSDSG